MLKHSRVNLAMMEVNRAVRESFDRVSFLEHLFLPAWGSVGDGDKQGKEQTEERMLTPENGEGRHLGDTPFLDFLMSWIFHCFCSFVFNYSAFYHLLIGGESRKGKSSFINLGCR